MGARGVYVSFLAAPMRSAGRWSMVAGLCSGMGFLSPAQGQRHPESAGPLPYYNADPGTPREPAWKQRPAFLRGPRDRYRRGWGRAFLNASNGLSYRNYADEKYILYSRGETSFREVKATGRPMNTRNVRWDRMGNYMGGDYQRVLSIEESRSGSDFSGYSYIDHKRLQFYIGHYAYKDLHWTATVGNGVSASSVRTMFTPLTLANSRQNVVRMDLSYRDRDRATLYYTRGGQQGTALLFSEWAQAEGNDAWDPSPVLQFGGHWQHDLGEYATLGGTLVNQVMNQTASSRSSFWRGDIPYEMQAPRMIRVFIADDSPEEARATARAYGVDVVLEGERAGQPVRLTSVDGDPDYDTALEASPPSGGTPLAGGGRQAVGGEPVIYTFNLPADVSLRSARFVADVAGDFRIGVRQTHDFFNVDRSGAVGQAEMEWPASFHRSEAPNRRSHKWYVDEEEEPYYTVVRAAGGRGTADNRQAVWFDYGIPTGQSLASVNWAAELVGLEFNGELAHNLRNFMFPVGDNEGRRSAERAWAWWVKGTKDLLQGVALGAELYRMEPDYGGGYDSYRGGLAFHIDRQGKPGDRIESVTHEFPLHEDNDDHDRFADDHSGDNAVAQPRELYPGWPNAGVYPGLDENVDNVADVDRNENFIVDWEEPFLTYDAEPPEFVYGIDFNNNGVPDFRENDDRPDYPYPRDQRGRHVFLRLNRLGRLGRSISVGHYDTRQIVGGGHSEALYLRYAYDVERKGVARLQLHFDVKKVEDDIVDHTFLYQVPPDDLEFINWYNRPDGPPEVAGFRRPPTPDLLQMRDSRVHLVFADAEYLGFRNTRLDHAMLWFRNSQSEIELQQGIGLLQPAAVLTRFSVVDRIDYTWSRGPFSVTPKFKHRTIFEEVDNETTPRTSYSDFIPIVLAHYHLTPRTGLQLGAQGLPMLPYKHWDRARREGTFTQTDYLVMFRLTSDYFGIRDNSAFIGYQRTRRNYTLPGRPDSKQGVLFVELISPF